MATVTFGIMPSVDFYDEYTVIASDGPQPSIEIHADHLTRCIVAAFQNDVEVMRKLYTSDVGYESTGLTASIQLTDGQTYSIVIYMDNNKDYIDVTDLTAITLNRDGYILDGDPQIFSADKFDITVTEDTSRGVKVFRRYCRISFMDTNPTSKIDRKVYAVNGYVNYEFNAYSGETTDAGTDYSFTNTSIAMLTSSKQSKSFILTSYSSEEPVKQQNISNTLIDRNYRVNVYWSSAARKSVDLTTLSGWSGLATGKHAMTVVAKANGYRNSDPSKAVSVTK